MRKLFALGAALALLAAGCSGGDNASTLTTTKPGPGDEAAARALVRVQAELRRGNFATAWQSLHPAERKVKDVRWTVPGTGETTDAKEITITATSPGSSPQTFTQHVVRIRGHWAWMLSAAYFKNAKTGTC